MYFVKRTILVTILVTTFSISSNISKMWKIETIDDQTSIDNYTISLTFKPGTDDAYVSYYDKSNKKVMLAEKIASGEWNHAPVVGQGNTENGIISAISYSFSKTKDLLGIQYSNTNLDFSTLSLSERLPSKIGGYSWFKKELDINTSNMSLTGSTLFYDPNMKAISFYSTKNFYNNLSFFYHYNDENILLNQYYNKKNSRVVPRFDVAYPHNFSTVDEGLIAYDDPKNDRIAILQTIPPTDNTLPTKATFKHAKLPSLTFDDNNKSYMAFWDTQANILKFAYENDIAQSNNICGQYNGWSIYHCDSLTNAGSATNIKMVMDSDNLPVIAYQNASDEQGPEMLSVARPIKAYGLSAGNCGPKKNGIYQWQCDIIDAPAYSHEADQLEIAISDKGLIMIVYTEYDEYYNTWKLKAATLRDSSAIRVLPTIYYILQ